ncbi:TIGR02587 family membrane protein [Phyllobacterium salinisoli]|uniref:TIGR02587 family membrane protein n=2 Tax=Phyllobacterium salinisoli TaxID=1899321 RepID=A0A368K9F1_9HYPH|nr:TIGR02587 family membrane protein [Phyllobacterium salinisoli]RCS25113.1 TIGR02587 family membrane protein [Phyllobacterium salinisoli]
MRASAGKLLRDGGRAVGGALIFSLPMLMTMEMWWLGFYADPLRLSALIAVAIPLLIGLSHRIGFRHTASWRDVILDAAFALGIGVFTSITALVLFGVIRFGMSAEEIVGKLSLQMIPASIGALLARGQFVAASDEPIQEQQDTYAGEMFLMGVGALFLGFNIAPTEETVLISYQMTPWHGIALVLLSLLTMHGFVFALGFHGGTELSPATPWWSALVRFTLPGYVVACCISLFVLWVFGRLDELPPEQIVMTMIVLAFPSAVGAAAARLIL